MKNFLIIGGSGYIGSVITKKLLSNGNKVKNLDNHLFNNRFSIEKYLNTENYKFIEGDLCSNEDLKKAVEGVTDVIILAGIVGDPLSKKYPLETDFFQQEL